MIINCVICRKIFKSSWKNAKYCSCKCRREANKVASLIKDKTCVICGEKFESSWRRAKYCSYSCRLENQKRYREKPNAASWSSIVEFINERDGYRCKECKSDKSIVVHHITFLSDGGNNNSDNLVTLCEKCHSGKHYL